MAVVGLCFSSVYADSLLNLEGDVYLDGKINLKDALLSLQLTAGLPSSQAVNRSGDVNSDGKIGTEEAIYALQVVARTRDLPYVDNDGDGYTENQSDCDDANATIYAGATEICGDGIDQNCNGCDKPCPADTVYALEDFDSTLGGFYEYGPFSRSVGRFRFRGDRSDLAHWTVWNGGGDPSLDWHPRPGHSNYFDEFNVAVDTYWDGGAEDYAYGLVICVHQNNQGGADYIGFYITKDGTYGIYQYLDNEYQPVVNWQASFLRRTNDKGNKLSIEKQGDNFRFYINDTEVHRLTLEGYAGGGIGLFGSHPLDASFDNFRIAAPANPSCQSLPFPTYSIAEQNEFVYKIMTSSYLWYHEVPQIDNFKDYSSPEALLENLKYKELDKWSYITSKKEHEALFEAGKYIGVGLGINYDINSEIRISFVYKDSPADRAGLVRGNRILKINGRSVNATEDDDIWDTIIGPVKVGIAVDMEIEGSDGTVKVISLEKEWVAINTVLHHEIINIGGSKIGYLVFNQFLDKSRDELQPVFNDFKQQGIDELILDLRYNGGGKTSVAEFLSALIAGDQVDEKIFVKYRHNDKFNDWNWDDRFHKPDNPLDLTRVVVVSTGETCSASEMVINGLKPYLNVILIGDTTCGKPVGMHGWDFGDKHINPIEFQVLNAVDVGEYHAGIIPNCKADDGLTKLFGDPAEGSLSEALHYLIKGSCTVKRTLKAIGPRKEIQLNGFRREIGAF